MNRSLAILQALAIGALGCALLSCQTYPDVPPAPQPKQVLYEWYDIGGTGELRIEISLARQIAKFERDGNLVGWSYAATGKSGFATPEGDFKVLSKEVAKTSNLYGWIENEAGRTVDSDASPSDPLPEGCRFVSAPMPYWMRLTWRGVGMHGGVIPTPGEPASHGCIRLPKRFAPVLYQAVKVGTPVTIRHDFIPRDRSLSRMDDWPFR